MAAKLFNLARMAVTTGGSSDLVLGAAATGFLTFASAGVGGGDTVTYAINDPSSAPTASEIGHASYLSSNTGLSGRTVIASNNANATINVSTAAQVFISPAREDILTGRGYIDGYILSNDTVTPNTKVDVAAGVCRDDSDVMNIYLSSARVMDLTTTGANGLDTGTLTSCAWYNVFAISNLGSSAATIASLASNAAPSFPAGYTLKRRVGSFRTSSASNVLTFSQFNDEFLWGSPFTDQSGAAVSTAATGALVTLTVPPYTKVLARMRIALVPAVGTANTMIIQSPDETAAIAGGSLGNADIASFNSTAAASPALNSQINIIVRTSSQAQVRWSASSSGATGYISTFGWFDWRGKSV